MKAMEKVWLSDTMKGTKEDQEFFHMVLDYYGAIAHLTETDPDPRMREVAAKAQFGIGVARNLLGQPGVEEAYAQSVKEYEGLLPNAGRRLDLLLYYGISLNYLGRQICASSGLDRGEATCLRAIQVFRGLAARDPSYQGYLARELTSWGALLAQAGHRDQAVQVYQEACDVDPRFSAPRNNLAWLLTSRPDLAPYDPSRALHLAEAAVAADPSVADSWNTLGVARARCADWAGAEEALEKSESLSPDGGTPADWLFLARIHARQGDLSRARELIDRSDTWLKAHTPSDPDLVYFRAEAATDVAQTALTPNSDLEGGSEPRESEALDPATRVCIIK